MGDNKQVAQEVVSTEQPKRVSKFWEACQKYKDDWIVNDPTILDRI